ncbi:MAG TPA: dTMP kinase [Pseudomonadales bacterium]|nr:dTMP kinase [Pseudomonadales bacterium]
MKKGKFLTIEGGEGVGKSTNIACVENFLLSRGITFIRTREPGGTPLAEELRNLLLAPREEKVCEKTELLLMFAARAQHLQQKILPALSQGVWVICDRFTDATYAYQGGGRGLSMDTIAVLENLVQEGLQPDLTLLLDVDVQTGMARASNRSEPDRFEAEQMAFFEAVRAVYRDRAAQQPQRFCLVDASQSLDAVQADIRQVMSEFMARIADE